MDANNVRKISQIILNRFTELHKESYVKFNKECLPMLISGISKDMYKSYSAKFLNNEDTINLLINKTFEICKFVDRVRIQDVRSLYNMIYKVGLLRYENYEVNENLKNSDKWNECSENLLNHYWETSEEDKKEFFKYLENVNYYTPEDKRYPEYYIENGGSLVKVSKELLLHLEGLNKTIVYGVKNSKYGHVIEEHLNCERSNMYGDCPVCDVGSSNCLACGEWEGDLTTHCRGHKISKEVENNLSKRLNVKHGEKIDHFLSKDIVIPEKPSIYNTENALNYFTVIVDQLAEQDSGSYSPETFLYLNDYFEEQFKRIVGKSEEVKKISSEVRCYLYNKLFRTCLYMPHSEYNNLAITLGNNYEKVDKTIKDLTSMLELRQPDFTIKDLDELCQFYENVFKTVGMVDSTKIREHVSPLSNQIDNFNLKILDKEFRLGELLPAPITVIKTHNAGKLYKDIIESLPKRSIIKYSVLESLTDELKILPAIYYVIPLAGHRLMKEFEKDYEKFKKSLREQDRVIYVLQGELDLSTKCNNVAVWEI